MHEAHAPQVGLGLFLFKDSCILLGQRADSHGEGEFGTPGGHLEIRETFEKSIMRELREEVGDNVQIKNLGYLCTTNLLKYLPKHYVDIGMIAELESGEPIVMESHKVTSWNWYDLDEGLPKNLFGCVENYIEAYKTGRVYFPTD